MIQDSELRRHIPGFLLIASLLIAIGAFLIWPPDREARTLFFPGTTSAQLSGERRLVPRTRDRTQEVRLVVEELILGPARIRHGRLLPRATDIRSVVLSGDSVYVDLSPQIMFGEDEVRVDVAAGLRGIDETLRYNFRWLSDVTITIGGQVPFQPAFPPIEDSPGER